MELAADAFSIEIVVNSGYGRSNANVRGGLAEQRNGIRDYSVERIWDLVRRRRPESERAAGKLIDGPEDERQVRSLGSRHSRSPAKCPAGFLSEY